MLGTYQIFRNRDLHGLGVKTEHRHDLAHTIRAVVEEKDSVLVCSLA